MLSILRNESKAPPSFFFSSLCRLSASADPSSGNASSGNASSGDACCRQPLAYFDGFLANPTLYRAAFRASCSKRRIIRKAKVLDGRGGKAAAAVHLWYSHHR